MSAPPSPTAHTANRRAIMLMAVAMSCLSTNDAIVRYVSDDVPVGQIMFLRGAALCLVLIIGCKIAGQAINVRDLAERWSLVRALGEVVATYLFLTSLLYVPIAVATTLVFSSPLFLTALSGPLFGERVGKWRWLAVIIGFSGVLLITAPGTGLWQPAMALPLAAAGAVVVRDISTRYVPDHVSSGSVTLTTAIAVTIGGALSLPFARASIGAADMAWLSLAAIIIAASFFSYVVALRIGELSLIAPVQYLSILWAVFYGAVIWGEVPGPREIAGGLIVIAAGLLILYRERVNRARQDTQRHFHGGADA